MDSTIKPSYFLVSVSTRENLELCIKHGLAGFPSGGSGAWTFCEIEPGDFVSFLYGAQAHNLYRVSKREAIRDAERLPPWKPLTFKESGRTYSFPFRLDLQPVRAFTEALVRSEFAYVAENLLLRGGYRKTHFQADQTTLQSVSEMGTPAERPSLELSMPQYSTFVLRFTRTLGLASPPETCRFMETILQSAIRRHLASQGNLAKLLARLGITELQDDALEILGEKAFPQGHVDLLLKQRVPLGTAMKIPIEVKVNRGQPDDLLQLRGYMDEIGRECPMGILIATDFGKQTREAPDTRIKFVRYKLASDLRQTPTFEEIYRGLTLEPM
ncbi:MAG: hypothetical protein ACRD4V_13475 [Candidatus Acidiferrales bacterium]